MRFELKLVAKLAFNLKNCKQVVKGCVNSAKELEL